MGESELPAAGWFPDPDRAAGLRYWDGRQWTGHLALDPVAEADVGRLVSEARRARLAIAVGVPLQAVAAVGQVYQVRESRRAMEDSLDRLAELQRSQMQPGTMGGSYTVVASRPLVSVGSSLSLPTLIVGVLFLIWFHRAATVASRLRRPARRSAGWAVGGWFIPIANFFLPYRSALDMFRPGDPDRSAAKRWWLAYLLALVVVQPLSTLAGYGEDNTGAVTLAVGAFALVLWQIAYLHARTFIEAATTSLAREAGSSR